MTPPVVALLFEERRVLVVRPINCYGLYHEIFRLFPSLRSILNVADLRIFSLLPALKRRLRLDSSGYGAVHDHATLRIEQPLNDSNGALSPHGKRESVSIYSGDHGTANSFHREMTVFIFSEKSNAVQFVIQTVVKTANT
jgi:hypothetical protein